MKMNTIMKKLHDALGTVSFVRMPDGLADLLSEGFIMIEECVFLSSLYSHKGNASRDLFPDEVGYECFVNHIHIDDYTKENLLAIALEYARQLELNWKGQSIKGTLRIIVSFEESNCVVRFHLVREKQDWLKDDLECYENDALFVLDVPTPP